MQHEFVKITGEIIEPYPAQRLVFNNISISDSLYVADENQSFLKSFQRQRFERDNVNTDLLKG